MGIRNKATPEKIKKYYGLADCHGIESFMCEQDFTTRAMIRQLKEVSTTIPQQYDANDELNQSVNMLVWRARANFQRHAVVYSAKLTDGAAKKIHNLINSSKPIEALTYLKENALEIGISKYAGQKRMWKNIPNPNLDPFYGED